MTSDPISLPDLEFHPLTPERWNDIENLLGANGADDGCWCMWWRSTRAEFAQQKGEGNRLALKAIVDSGQVPGLIAYANHEPIAWCSVGPRETFQPLNRSRTLKRVDSAPVWSIICFYVAKPYRGKGLMIPFLKAVIEYAREQGAKIVEGYPVELDKVLAGTSGYMGVVPAYREAGFVEVLRRSQSQPIMRYFI